MGAAAFIFFVLCASLAGAGASRAGAQLALGLRGGGVVAAWKRLVWVNSNSGSTFNWELGGVAADAYVAAPFTVADSSCSAFGGAVAPGVAAKSMSDALPSGASLSVWMQPRDKQFLGVPTGGLVAAIESALQEFQQCMQQDWPAAPQVSGFMCVHEQQIGITCDALAPTVMDLNLAFGVLGAPGVMDSSGVTAALGEMYEPAFFPNGACPGAQSGAAYGAGVGAYLNKLFLGANLNAAVPAFGGTASSTCPLDYAQLGAAAAALSASTTVELQGIALWS
jgi:hypothetical protein